MHRSRLLENPISDYPFLRQFIAGMHPRLQQDVETQYIGEEDINNVIAMAERLDSIQRSTGVYGKEPWDKQAKVSTHKKTKNKLTK